MKLELGKSCKRSHDDCVWACTWLISTDGDSRLVTGSLDKTIKIWDSNLNLMNQGEASSRGIISVAAHPYRNWIAWSSLTGIVNTSPISEFGSNANVSLHHDGDFARQIQFNPEGTLLAVAGGESGSVTLYDTTTWTYCESLCTKTNEEDILTKFVISVAWSSTGKELACGSMDGSISVFDVEHKKLLHFLSGHTKPVRSLAYLSPVDLVSGSDDKCINIYNAEGKTPTSSMSGHSSWVLSVDVSPNHAAIASGSSDRTVKLWDIKMMKAVHTMANHTDQVWGVKFKPGGAQLASVSDDTGISLYTCS